MAIRISVSFRESSEADLRILNYLETKRSKSIFIKELIEDHMKKEEQSKNKLNKEDK